MNPKEVPIEILCRSWLDAKREEEEAADRRKALGLAIVSRLPVAEAEGAHREEFGDIKLVVTHKMTRTVDKAIAEAWSGLPDVVQAAFRWKPEIELKNLRALEFANPGAYAAAAKFITTKPAVPSISVEAI